LLDATDGTDPSFLNYNFKNCIVTVDELVESDQFPNFFDRCEDCINATRNDTIFLNLDENQLSLDTMSIALDKGISIPFIDNDILGVSRDSNTPDLGCFELN